MNGVGITRYSHEKKLKPDTDLTRFIKNNSKMGHRSKFKKQSSKTARR